MEVAVDVGFIVMIEVGVGVQRGVELGVGIGRRDMVGAEVAMAEAGEVCIGVMREIGVALNGAKGAGEIVESIR